MHELEKTTTTNKQTKRRILFFFRFWRLPVEKTSLSQSQKLVPAELKIAKLNSAKNLVPHGIRASPEDIPLMCRTNTFSLRDRIYIIRGKLFRALRICLA